MTSMIEVDPKLFITCRLCLEDMGQYQIVPAVQHQIKYCFDIDVEPFDGLPQLICKKCEAILSDYFKIKKTFIDKQNHLKTKIGEKKVKLEQSQQEIVTSSQQYDSETVGSNQVLTCAKRKMHIPSTSSETLSVRSDTSHRRKTNRKIAISSWELDYNKLYGCKLCKRYFRRKCDLNNHRFTHNQIRKKYNFILKNNCTLKLEKLDGKPNMTGRNAVVHDNSKIIEDEDENCFIIYVPRNNKLENDKYEATYDSDEEFIIKKKRRTMRLLSKSSSDTVVIETNDDNRSASDDERPVIDIQPKDQDKSECIHIDDSSDSSSDKNNSLIDHQYTIRKKVEATFSDYKTIENIISMCQNKYQKRVDVDTQNNKLSANYPFNSVSQLERKVLSIGRKVVNKQLLFNCTGILRFLEYKNLEITWLPKIPIYNYAKDSYYIRILTKKKTNKNVIDNSELGWTDISNVVLKQNVVVPNFALDIQGNDIPTDASDNGISCNDINGLSVDYKNKILNANPVANPKQLPKKPIANDLKFHNIIPISSIQNQNTHTFANVTPIGIEDNVENIHDNLCMPIITSTTSLAPEIIETKDKCKELAIEPEKCETQPLSNSLNANMPRIKVKPVSELMSEKVLKSINENTPSMSNIVNQQTNIYNQQGTIHYFPGDEVQNDVSNLKIVQVQGAVSNLSTEKATTLSPVVVTSSDFVILDTVELPNIKTAVPFEYLTKLLQIHNITLLKTNAILSEDSICLIKFKVLYKQETKDQPVVICLSLFCYMNTFCIKVKDRNQDDIDMTKISPNWQWEIIKLFKGDVVQKLLNSAQKVSCEVFEYTKSFLCLIKSINIK